LAEAKERYAAIEVNVKTFKCGRRILVRTTLSEILLAISWHDQTRIEFIREQIKFLPVSVSFCPILRSNTHELRFIGRARILVIEVQRAPLQSDWRLVKRTLDICASDPCLVVFIPVMALTCSF